LASAIKFQPIRPIFNESVTKPVILPELSSMEYKGHILFVDDEPTTVEMYTLLLRKKGYYVSPFLSSIEALSFLRFTNKKIDLIIADLNMPLMDGLEFLKKVKKISGFLTTPFIFLTAIDDHGFHLDAYHSGALDYVQKPIDNELLLAKVDAIVNSYQMNELENKIVIRGSQQTFAIEEIIQYCEQEKVSGYALISHLSRKGLITFDKGILKDIELENVQGTKAFEKMKSWRIYRFLIVQGQFTPQAEQFLQQS